VKREVSSNINKSNINNPGPETYKLQFGFDLVDKEKDAGSSTFK
jgi:hypothetical protein